MIVKLLQCSMHKSLKYNKSAEKAYIHIIYIYIYIYICKGGARGVMVIVAGDGHGDTSSNPGRD